MSFAGELADRAEVSAGRSALERCRVRNARRVQAECGTWLRSCIEVRWIPDVADVAHCRVMLRAIPARPRRSTASYSALRHADP